MSEIVVITTAPNNVIVNNTDNNVIVQTQTNNTTVVEQKNSFNVNVIEPTQFLAVETKSAPEIVTIISPGDKNFLFTQSVSSAFWVVTHNLNKFPAVTVVDTAGTEGYGTVHHIDANNLTIGFSAPFSGKATLN